MCVCLVGFSNERVFFSLITSPPLYNLNFSIFVLTNNFNVLRHKTSLAWLASYYVIKISTLVAKNQPNAF